MVMFVSLQHNVNSGKLHIPPCKCCCHQAHTHMCIETVEMPITDTTYFIANSELAAVGSYAITRDAVEGGGGFAVLTSAVALYGPRVLCRAPKQ